MKGIRIRRSKLFILPQEYSLQLLNRIFDFLRFLFQLNCSLFNDMTESAVVPQANLKIVLSGI